MWETTLLIASLLVNVAFVCRWLMEEVPTISEKEWREAEYDADTQRCRK